jgi:hypothetical protein
MVPNSRLRSIGWAVILAISLIMFAALTFRVNAVKSQVMLAERKILALEQQKSMLETEFQARASQQQLANWNDVDFGYKAPTAGQFLECSALRAPQARRNRSGWPPPRPRRMRPAEPLPGLWPWFLRSPAAPSPPNFPRSMRKRSQLSKISPAD